MSPPVSQDCLQVQHFEASVLQTEWAGRPCGIWGAGRDGRQFLNALTPESKERVTAFYDIDPNKIGSSIHGIPVLSRDKMQLPVVICVALDREEWAESIPEALAELFEQPPIVGVDYYQMV
eukprot:TRINITY_DN30646_c0_g1_i1.p2 TRINITY_DN30646_c0_g1~~TRINITY_DN30646_c0_g1_i1.p2  ORF type:complete len:121 (+),score=22.53 TRINITY_DN30646_c0_g1_i1:406-768(+)